MGTRISEESHLKPKPMIEVGNRLIISHIICEYLPVVRCNAERGI